MVKIIVVYDNLAKGDFIADWGVFRALSRPKE
jgi:hypothetical protein